VTAESPIEPATIPPERNIILIGWAWAVSGVLILFGVIGLFSHNIGPLPTNHLHALVLDLGVGFGGFAFARFSAEHTFVLISGIGMIAIAVLGFAPPTREWLYETFSLSDLSSWGQLATGVVSLALWTALHPRPGTSLRHRA